MGVSYDPHIRQKALERILAGDSVTQVHLDTGISEASLRSWRIEHRHQKQPEQVSTKSQNMRHTVLAIPDMHHPFCHQDALAFLREVKAVYKPDTVICLGDEADFHAFSRWPTDPDGMAPGKELAAAIDALMPFYIEFPEMMVCESNHTTRPMKKLFEAGLPAAFYPTYSKMLNAPDGWRWQQHWIIDGVRYHHGDAGKSGQFAPAQYMKAFKQSNVHGHLHGFACVMYEGPHFGINAGCLIDQKAYAFKYGRNIPIPVSLGCAIVIDGKAGHFIPMILDSNDRWIGRL